MNIKEQIDEEKNKLYKLFEEMLDFKKIPYKKDLDFLNLLELVSIHYNSFSVFFDYVYYGLKYYSFPPSYDDYSYNDEVIEVTDENNLESLKELYEALTEEKNDYKVHAYDFVDINLKEGQTLKDLSDEYREKFGPLFKEMLDFIKVEIPTGKQNDFYDLWHLVATNYPWYYDLINHLYFIVYFSLDANYIDQIDSMDRVYKKLINYKAEYNDYVLKYKDIIEERKDWLKECDKLKMLGDKEKLFKLMDKDPYNKIYFPDDQYDFLDIEEE